MKSGLIDKHTAVPQFSLVHSSNRIVRKWWKGGGIQGTPISPCKGRSWAQWRVPFPGGLGFEGGSGQELQGFAADWKAGDSPHTLPHSLCFSSGSFTGASNTITLYPSICSCY